GRCAPSLDPVARAGHVSATQEETMLRIVLGALAGLAALATAAGAQTYPARPITMVIPLAAGGPTDVLGRVVAQRMGELLGQTVLVENVGGAGGQTGSKRVSDSPPDGYNILIG